MRILNKSTPSWILFIVLIISSACATQQVRANRQSTAAIFNWFEYEGKDDVFSSPLKDGEYQNPILAGFHPDPSITRVGQDYYLVNSSFSYSPGLPIYHSRDLVNWRFLAHALESQSDLNFTKQATMSRGIFAPTIREHNGTYYIVSTAVDAGGNFLITAQNPAGPWSNPIWLPELSGGIDPDIFFDDGKIYIAHNGPPAGTPKYQGHRALWMWEFDQTTKRIVGDSKRLLIDGGVDIAQEPIWIEGPHLYKIKGWYYLSAAEGGTGTGHSQVVFRSRTLEGEFSAYPNNPILTQRTLPVNRDNPINATGHADLVQTPNGDWWAVFLGIRNYQQTHFNTGRETFLLPVAWSDDWPTILEPGKAVPYRLAAPKHDPSNGSSLETEPMTGNFVSRDDFKGAALGHHWNFLRTSPKHDWYSLSPKTGSLSLYSLPTTLYEYGQPAFIARRQQHMSYTATTELVLPSEVGHSAGISAFQSEAFHYYLGVRKHHDGHTVFLEKTVDSTPTTVATINIKTEQEEVTLGINLNTDKVSFSYQLADSKPFILTDNADATNLSTQKAGGFVGSYVGLHSRIESTEIQR